MSAVREAIVLPLLFLTVVFVGALRPGAPVPFVPPSLASLVAGMALFALLVRSGVVAPERLMHQMRGGLPNLNGLTVLVTTFVASAQLITMMIPESGAPAFVAWVVLISLLSQAFAIAPDRARLLRGLLVTFGAAFTLKYVVLASLSAPAGGRFARALQLLFEGVTFGAVTQRVASPLEGYLAFGAVVLYLVGLTLLPPAAWQMIRSGPKELTE